MPRLKIAAAAIALLPAAAFAQSPEIVIADFKRTDIVVTATGSEQTPEQTGQSITLLNREQIASRQTPSVAELLAQTPGITISRNGGPGQTAAVRIRGAEDSQTLVLIDGVRVNDPGAPAGSFDFGNLMIGNIERIEVLRGPNSVPWGSAAIGGVVNIVTGSDEGVRTQAEYGSRNAAQLVAQGGINFGPVTASLGGGYFSDDGISAFKGGSERDPFRHWALNGRIGVKLSNDLSVELRTWYADSKVSFDGFPPPSYTFADTRQFSKTQQLGIYAAANLTTGPVKHRLAFVLADTARDSIDPDDSFNNFFSRGRNERVEYRGDATISSAIRAVFGAEHEWTRFRDQTERYSTHATSGYAQVIITPADPLTLTSGIRVDRYKTYGTKATLSANAAWRIGSETVLRAAYGEGFKAPSLFQLFGKSFGVDLGNTQLQPETAKSYEIGIEQSLIDSTLKFGVTAFHRDTANQIDFTSVPPRVDRPFGYYVNVARARAQGVETFIELRPTRTLVLNANYTLTDAKNRLTGADLLRRPRHSINANIDWSPRDWIHLGGSVQTVSDSRDSDYLTFSPTSLDGYTLLGLRASVSLGQQFELYGRVENLTDTRYETVSGYGTAGRNAHVGVRVKL